MSFWGLDDLAGFWTRWQRTSAMALGRIMVWFLGQNIGVEMFLYHDQLAEGKPISWTPLAPAGPWLNPTLFAYRDRTITLQGQIPWLLMGPLFYLALTRHLSRTSPTRIAG